VSAAAPSARPRVGVEVGLTIPALAGIALLLLRLRILDTSGATRITLLTAVFAAILVTSLLVPVAPDVARVRPWIVTAVGLAGVGLAALASGRPIPAPLGASALPLAIVAAVAEEALFRRAVYGRLERLGPAVAVAGSALLFAAVHLPLYGAAALPVDLGAGLLFSLQRWASGTWTVPAGTHSVANVVAVMLR
jgi:membrane protease YdiL (CAAX protease family)